MEGKEERKREGNLKGEGRGRSRSREGREEEAVVGRVGENGSGWGNGRTS